MKDLTFRQLRAYLLNIISNLGLRKASYQVSEEVGEVAEVLNGRSGRKESVQDSNEELAKDPADIIYYTVAIATINDIDLTKPSLTKIRRLPLYQHERDLKNFWRKISIVSFSSTQKIPCERDK